MQIVLDILVIAVAIEHIFIMLLEMFFIKSSVAKRTFNIDSKLLDKKEVRVMFANQGLYNGFLAAGLFWSFFYIRINVNSIKIFLFRMCNYCCYIWSNYIQ